MMAYPEYKATGLHWLPQIPKHWDWLFLSQISEEQKIKNIAAKEKNVLSLSYGNIIRKKNLNGGLTPQDWATYQIVFPGNIILRLTDLQNDHTSLRTGRVKEQGIITSAYTCVKTSRNSAFLHYLLHAYDIQKVFYGFGGGVRQSIGYKALRNLCFPVPSPDEQAQIVRYLDAMTAKINKLIRAKKKQIALLQEQKQAIINRVVTQGLDPNVEMKDSGIDWLGKIPKHWKVNRLKRFCKINASISRQLRQHSDEDEVVFLPMENISVEGNIDCSVKKRIADVKSGFSSFAQNDVVIAKITPCFENGKGACLSSLETDIGFGTTELIVIRGFEGIILPEYLYYITRLSVFRKLGADVMTGAAGQKRVPPEFIANFVIGIPDIQEQKKILHDIHAKFSGLNESIRILENELDVLKEYKNSLISAVVTGKMDVRGLAIEDVLPEDMTINDEEAGEDVEEEMTEAEREGEVL